MHVGQGTEKCATQEDDDSEPLGEVRPASQLLHLSSQTFQSALANQLNRTRIIACSIVGGVAHVDALVSSWYVPAPHCWQVILDDIPCAWYFPGLHPLGLAGRLLAPANDARTSAGIVHLACAMDTICPRSLPLILMYGRGFVGTKNKNPEFLKSKIRYPYHERRKRRRFVGERESTPPNRVALCSPPTSAGRGTLSDLTHLLGKTAWRIR